MKCPNCGSEKHGVIKTDKNLDLGIPRIRRCRTCGSPFQTVEMRREAIYRVIRLMMAEGTTICITGKDHCKYLRDDKCGVVVGKHDPLLCRAFKGRR